MEIITRPIVKGGLVLVRTANGTRIAKVLDVEEDYTKVLIKLYTCKIVERIKTKHK